jgi:hypothetical protein
MGLGIDYIGSGFFSSVYTDPQDRNRVIKVGSLPDAWVNYAAFAIDNSHKNPHLPKVHFIRRITDNTGKGIYVANMEKLAPHNSIPELGGLQGVKKMDEWRSCIEEVRSRDTVHLRRLATAVDNTLVTAMTEIKVAIGSIHDLGPTRNTMSRASSYHYDPVTVITDPSANVDAAWDVEDPSYGRNFDDRWHDGYYIPDKEPVDAGYMVRAEVRVPRSDDRLTQESLALRDKQVVIRETGTGQVLGVLPQVPDALQLPDRYTTFGRVEGL